MGDGVVVEGACGGDFALEGVVLLDGAGDGVVCAEFGVGFDLWEEAAKGGVDLCGFGVARGFGCVGATAEGGDGFHYVGVKGDGAFNKAGKVFEDDDALFEEVVNL